MVNCVFTSGYRPNRDLEMQTEELLNKLTYREREIIKLRYGLGDADGYTYTLEEVAKIFKITREKARFYQLKALWKMEKMSKGDEQQHD